MQQITGEYQSQSVISIKLKSNFIEITLWHGCSSVTLLHFFRTLFTKNISERLLLLHISSRAFFEKPYAYHFANSKSWFIVSKAFETSINNTQTFLPLSSALLNLSNMVINECRVPCEFLESVMYLDSLFSIQLVNCLQIIPSKTFDTCNNKLTGP